MFEPEVHRYARPFGGNAAAAFDLARTALVSQGFEILSETDSELRARGPGMHSNQQSAILGATEMLLRVNGSEIVAIATLGGVAKMSAFVILFPPGLALSLLALWWFTGTNLTWGYAAMMVAPWLVFGPWMAASMKRSTENAVDGMVRGMAQIGSRR